MQFHRVAFIIMTLYRVYSKSFVKRNYSFDEISVVSRKKGKGGRVKRRRDFFLFFFFQYRNRSSKRETRISVLNRRKTISIGRKFARVKVRGGEESYIHPML